MKVELREKNKQLYYSTLHDMHTYIHVTVCIYMYLKNYNQQNVHILTHINTMYVCTPCTVTSMYSMHMYVFFIT